MTVKARSSASVHLAVGDVWPLEVRVSDSDGSAVSDTLTVTVTNPNGVTSTPAAAALTCVGRYRAEVPITAAGRWVAHVASATYGAVDFTANAGGITAAAAMPSVADLDTYLGTHSATDDQLEDVLGAETDAQARVCRIPAHYSRDLRQALLRRCARNLAMRRIPVAVLQGDSQSTILPGNDPEVRRFERPYRKLPTG